MKSRRLILNTGITLLLLQSACRTSPSPSIEQFPDWTRPDYYQQDNLRLSQSKPEKDRVIFFGDSITFRWDLKGSFPGRDWINRGVGMQATPHMLVRFRADVIDLKPRIVVILAGINDLAGNAGPMTLKMITDNYASMAELARAHDIQVVFASLLPVRDLNGREWTGKISQSGIRELNDWLKSFCQNHQHTWLDYYSQMKDQTGQMRQDLTDDGLHPNANGYEIMASLAEKAVAETLRQKN